MNYHTAITIANTTNSKIVVTDLCNLDDVNHGHGHVYIHRDVHIVDLVKAERSNFLVVIVLDLNQYLDFYCFLAKIKPGTFMKMSLQLSSSLSSTQLEVWSHLYTWRTYLAPTHLVPTNFDKVLLM